MSRPPVRLNADGWHCADCGEPIYESGCPASCYGVACPECGTGCDINFLLAEDSLCAAELGHTDPQPTAGRSQPMTLTDKEERAMANTEAIASQITHDDVIRLTRWMAGWTSYSGWYDVRDIADAVEKPWKWWDEIQALREGKEPEVEE